MTNNLEIQGPGGVRVSAHGPLVILLIVILAAFAAVVWTSRVGTQARAMEHYRLESTQRAMVRALRVQTWLLSPADQRPILPRPVEADEFLLRSPLE